MSNENADSKKVILGLAIGAVVGLSTLYLIKAARCQKTPILHKIGKTVCEVGKALEECELESFNDIAQEVKKVLPKSGDVMGAVLNWISSGVSLLQKIKNGG